MGAKKKNLEDLSNGLSLRMSVYVDDGETGSSGYSNANIHLAVVFMLIKMQMLQVYTNCFSRSELVR